MAITGTIGRVVARIQAQILLHPFSGARGLMFELNKMLWVKVSLKAPKKQKCGRNDKTLLFTRVRHVRFRASLCSLLGYLVVFTLKEQISPLSLWKWKKCNSLSRLQTCQISMFTFHFPELLFSTRLEVPLTFPSLKMEHSVAFFLWSTPLPIQGFHYWSKNVVLLYSRLQKSRRNGSRYTRNP